MEKHYPPGVTVGHSEAPPPYPTAPSGPSAPYPTQAGVPTAAPVVVTAGIAASATDTLRYGAENVKRLRYVPAMPMCLSITFYIWNCIVPGFGMWFACLCLCCSNTVVRGDSMLKVLCITFALGFLSILTLVFGIGYWIAIVWSVGTIANSRLYYNNPIDESEIRERPVFPGMPNAPM